MSVLDLAFLIALVLAIIAIFVPGKHLLSASVILLALAGLLEGKI